MENHYNCIYMYVNKVNGHKYVGQAIDFNRRHKAHIVKSANKTPIDRAFNKYGSNNFEIIILKENLSTQCLLNFWECYYIEKYNTLTKDNEGYNISNGGSNGNTFAGKTEEEMNEFKQKQSDAHKGENNYWYGKTFSEEHKQAISEGRKGKKNPRARKISQHDRYGNLIRVWDYIKQASEELDIAQSRISKSCQFWEMNCNKEKWYKKYKGNPNKSAGGYIWKYYEEE